MGRLSCRGSGSAVADRGCRQGAAPPGGLRRWYLDARAFGDGARQVGARGGRGGEVFSGRVRSPWAKPVRVSVHRRSSAFVAWGAPRHQGRPCCSGWWGCVAVGLSSSGAAAAWAGAGPWRRRARRARSPGLSRCAAAHRQLGAQWWAGVPLPRAPAFSAGSAACPATTSTVRRRGCRALKLCTTALVAGAEALAENRSASANT